MQNHLVWRDLMIGGVCLSIVGAQHAAPLQSPTPATALTPRDSAFHALNRLAYGPRPGEVPRVAAEGVMRWIDRQLSVDGIDDHGLAERERQFQVLEYDRGDLAAMYTAAQRERRERKLAAAPDTMADKDAASPIAQRGRRLAGEFADLAVVRAALSERQLYEIMVDFWTNHFNVYFAKGADRFLTPDYIEHTIRPRAMGKFADLLIATAKSPAMLFYLDNWESVAPGTSPPFPRSARRRGGQGVRPMPKGINENYARELLELHTLGVDGGYTQQDVIDVARIFTGWSIERPQQGGDFEFHEWAHDRGDKQVLGVRFEGGHNMDEGIRLLKLLASDPATMHHVSRKLCQRFVSDDPPDGCVDDAVAAWKRSSGDMRDVLRAIFHGPDFWAAENVRAKVKTPLEFVVSAARAVDAQPDTSPRLAQVVARLGEPLYLHVAPDGYPERETAWVNSGALLDRMNAAVALAAGKLQGVTVALDSIVSAGGAEELIGVVNEKILGGTMSENTKQVLRRELAGISDPMQARALAVGLAIGGPEFQRQ
ncbi:MAG: DUF1800 domain-containing protein [Gemmatimonadetes bacterium]|nr:MAG: DUF1800 domain-containing protein [Gemmatimonadota bacterium]